MLEREDVLEVIGEIDDLEIARLMATDATREELEEARDRLYQDNGFPKFSGPVSARVGKLMTLLSRIVLDEEEEEAALA